jgi:hypothetical protein
MDIYTVICIFAAFILGALVYRKGFSDGVAGRPVQKSVIEAVKNIPQSVKNIPQEIKNAVEAKEAQKDALEQDEYWQRLIACTGDDDDI